MTTNQTSSNSGESSAGVQGTTSINPESIFSESKVTIESTTSAANSTPPGSSKTVVSDDDDLSPSTTSITESDEESFISDDDSIHSNESDFSDSEMPALITRQEAADYVDTTDDESSSDESLTHSIRTTKKKKKKHSKTVDQTQDVEEQDIGQCIVILKNMLTDAAVNYPFQVAVQEEVESLKKLFDSSGTVPFDTMVSTDDGRKKLLKRFEKNMTKKTEEYEKERQNNASALIVASCKSHLARRNFKKVRNGVQSLQALVRGNRIRGVECQSYVLHLKDFRALYSKFQGCIEEAKKLKPTEGDWSSLKENQTFIRRQELLEFSETGEKLDTALTETMSSNFDANHDAVVIEEKEVEMSTIRAPRTHDVSTNIVRKLQFSGDVVKWVRNADPKYKELFIKRMKQLQRGDSSRILQKRLQGSDMTIYEVYLEQKSGFRILWTEKNEYVLVWYVAKHKSVSRLIKLIDESNKRSEKKRIYQEVDGLELVNNDAQTQDKNDRKNVILDPLGNVPMKRYRVDSVDEISDEDWTPSMVLTAAERDVVDTKGTTLLLGRSGTGKTICIANRMEADRQKYKGDNFSQLFVARSSQLCRYVENIIGPKDYTDFNTFNCLVSSLEEELPSYESIPDDFITERSDKYMNFSRFKKVFDSDSCGIDPLIVWTNIRSFIKGSLEAFSSADNVVSRESFVSFGKRRVRYSEEQRHQIYSIFEQYQIYLKENEMWDDCDRILSLLLRLQKSPDPRAKLQFSKVYIDEVQDYTQTECLIFFSLCGTGNLFFAGDPAQNVAKGVEFRFEDIRSVGHFEAKMNSSSKEMVLSKPKVININFRSHAGILDTAAGVLTELFAVFPESAKELGKDAGLFEGPRPGVFRNIQAETLKELVSNQMNGVVVLTDDDYVDEAKQMLGGYELVYGIRSAKGLEFKSVIVMNFFLHIAETNSVELQKAWREMLFHREHNLSYSFSDKYPEVECQLKLLYTAVTRTVERLFFAETSSSVAGDAFIRWATETSVKNRHDHSTREKALATISDANSLENMAMNQDEWVAAGLQNAEAADNAEDDGEAKTFFKKASYCFEQANHESFIRKVGTQLQSLELRSQLSNGSIRKDFEDYGSGLLQQVLEENLYNEAKLLIKAMQPFVLKLYPASTDFLEKNVLSHIKH